ncbi:PREDICTED: inositol monophosphatase 3-like [Priapulus caudatus]|uniref:inositol-phosphate phosphatase n=1 Tax=Priapulus caudatus TaxID=37621 RepID=A0ABM1ESK0_PRICU|nr:PREDICTED: inositol monophosphatase 3-like [Priapulus caudatus]
MLLLNVKINPISIMVVLVVSGLLIFYIWSGRRHQSHTHSDDSNMSAEKVSIMQLLSVSIDAAHRGGREVIAVRESSNIKEKSKGKTKEGANNPITEGDVRSHRAMVGAIKKAFPDLVVISEEHENLPDDLQRVPVPDRFIEEVTTKFVDDVSVPISDIVVWIDPLDATQEYTENLLHYVTTMVCVAVKGEPVLGVIHQPFEKYTAWGWVDHGHSDKLSIQQSTADGIKIIASRAHQGTVNETAIKAFGPTTQVIPAGGAGYKTLQVIQGNADAYLHTTLIKKWDICAGAALLKSVGGTMTTRAGATIDFSAAGSSKNDGGLLATLHDHDLFLTKLTAAAAAA